MTKPTEVTFQVTIDLNQALRSRYALNYEGEPYEAAPPSLEAAIFEAVVQAIADRVIADAPKDFYPNMRSEAKKHLDRKLGEQAAEMTQAALAEVVTETDSFGQPKGQPRTFREYLTERIEGWLSSPATGDRASYGKRQTNAEAVIASALDHAFTRELKAAVEKGKQQSLAVVQARSAELMAQAIGSLAEKGK